MIPSTLFALSLVVSFGPAVTRTGPATTIDPAIERADGAFLDGDYQRALDGYTQLYSRTREPNYLHNVASCYQKLGSFEQAIEYFTRYLEVGKDVDAVARAEVRRTIEQLRAQLRVQPRPQPQPQPQPIMRQRRGEGAAPAVVPSGVSPASLLSPPASGPPLAPPPLAEWPATPASSPEPTPPGPGAGPGGPPVLAEVPLPVGGPTATSVVQPATQPAAPEHRSDSRSVESVLRAAAIVEAGLGVAALGMGIYFGARARSLQHQVADGKVFDAYADRDGQRANAYEYGMLTVGGALLAGSAAFFYCSYLAGSVPSRFALLPAVGANGAGGALAARF